MNANHPDSASHGDLRAAVEDLSRRLKIVEARLGIREAERAAEVRVPELSEAPPAVGASERDSLEFELGQNWFALIGIVVLAIGLAFLISLPYPEFPSYLPSLGGYLLCGVILVLARLVRHSFETIAKYLRGAVMLLLFFATLRLCYFGRPSALDPASTTGEVIFLAVVVMNLLLAWFRRSPQLLVLAMVTGFAAALAVGTPLFFLGVCTAMILVAAYAQLARQWRVMSPLVFALAMVSYVIWAIGNPLDGNPLLVRTDPLFSTQLILLWVVVLSVVTMAREDSRIEDTPVQVTGLLLCGLGFLGFTLHSLFGFQESFLFNELLAFVVFLVLGLVFWIREQSVFSTFLYSMTGYAALSLALIKGFGVPEVFVALSLQSLVVIGTAIFFRSRFIIVANCLIFIGIIIGYMALTREELGMSIGFGIVALISARVLNWQKDRLALQTDLMRIVYLVIAFLVFPYALYYLVPSSFVAVSWAGLALFYYAMNLVIRNPRYRWMGHATLLLTVLYVAFVGTRQMESRYRILSFLFLGTVMLVVSIVFTSIRARHRREEKGEEE